MENKTKIVNLGIEDITPYNFGEYAYGSRNWVDFGVDNDYPVYLRTLYLNSPTHQQIVEGVTNLATGDGVSVVAPEKFPISNKWVNDNFPTDVVKQLIGDLKLYGYMAIEVYNGSIVKYSEALKYRFAHKDDNNELTHCWYSNDWDNWSNKQNKPVELPLYSEGSDEPLQILIVQLDKKGFQYYAPTDYCAGINYISLESEISIFHLSSIKNGLMPSFMATFIGSEFSEEQQNSIEKSINSKFQGSANAGRAILSFVANKDDAPILETIETSSLPEQYDFLSSESTKKIMLAHGVTSPLLMGIRDEGGGLGSNKDELESSYKLFKAAKLNFYQNKVVELITTLMNGNLLFGTVKFLPYDPFVDKIEEKLSKVDEPNEINSHKILSAIDDNATKTENVELTSRVFDGVVKEDHLYKFIKASKVNNIVNKKFELMDKKGYLQKPNDLIKNTKDYYWLEKKYIK